MSHDDFHAENKLLTRLRRGEELAFSEIYAMHAAGLIRYVFQKIGDLTEAQDIVHDIFTKLWDRRNLLEIDSSLSGYLYRQALNQCLNLFRHQRVVEAYLVRSLAEFLDTSLEAPADTYVLNRELGDRIQEQIEALSPKMRETVELRLHKGYSNREIAEAMKVSEHTVATQMKRALKLLRGKLQYMFFFVTLL